MIEIACPMTDEWLTPISYSDFYLAHLSIGKNNGNSSIERGMSQRDNLLRNQGSHFEFNGKFWEFEEAIQLDWILAKDDYRLSTPENEPERFCHNTPVHLHTNFLIPGCIYHIDYLHWDRTGPLHGFFEYRVYQGSNMLARGGNWGMSLGVSGVRNWPLACEISDRVILFTRFQTEKPPVDLPPFMIYHQVDQ